MRKSRIAVLALMAGSVVAGIAGCDDDRNTNTPADSSTDPGQPDGSQSLVQDAINRGELPQLDQSTSLEGDDKDGNGIRDDVERVIAALPDTSEQKQAMVQAHKALVMMMEAGSGDTVSVNDAAAKLGRAQNCLFSVYGPELFQQRWETIRADTFNTDGRIRANLAFSQKMSGRVGTVPSGDTCDEYESSSPRLVAG